MGGERWQPIETAPKDGTEVLLVCADAYTPAASCGWWGWWNKQEGWHHFSLPDDKWSGGVYRWFPTHWMPLPAPPTPGEEGGEG